MKRQSMTPHLESPRLILCPPTPEDSLILGNLWRNEEVRAFLGGIISDDLIIEKWTAIQNHWDQYGFGLYSVYHKASEEPIGLCGPHHTEDGLELSFLFFPQYWGQGLAKEATFACIDYGFRILKVDSIIVITQQTNARSCRLLEGIGMKSIRNFIRYDAIQTLYKIQQEDFLKETESIPIRL